MHACSHIFRIRLTKSFRVKVEVIGLYTSAAPFAQYQILHALLCLSFAALLAFFWCSLVQRFPKSLCIARIKEGLNCDMENCPDSCFPLFIFPYSKMGENKRSFRELPWKGIFFNGVVFLNLLSPDN